MEGAWLTGALVAATVTHLLLVVLALWIRRRAEYSASDAVAETGDERVTCPDCGVANDPEYRFCRQCVSELPGAGTPGAGGVVAADRRTL